MVNSIKVLKDNLNKIETKIEKYINPYPRKLICDNCGSELEYDESDLRMGEYGCMFVDCPICGQDNMLEDNERSITLTVDNIEFPVHFVRTNKDLRNVKEINSDEIVKKIREAITFFRANKDEYSWYTCYGDLFLIVFRYSDDKEYHVVVSKDFYDTYIPFDKRDCE